MTLLLTRSDVKALLDYDSCIEAVEKAFLAEAEGRSVHAAVLGSHVDEGGFHVKTAGIRRDHFYYAAKINANFPANPSRWGLPTIQGVLSLHSATDGRLLALMDSMEVTSIRTAAASAVAAKHLARPDSQSVLIVGAGNQGRSHLEALSRVLKLERVLIHDIHLQAAQSLAAAMANPDKWSVSPVADYRVATKECDVIVTCTPSRTPLLDRPDIARGTFLAAVGADNETKHEITPALMAASTVVVDSLDQCSAIGDLHHAIESRSMTREMVHAELADVVSGKRRGRARPDEIIVFDSTGTALEDVAAASLAYERALSSGRGSHVDLGA